MKLNSTIPLVGYFKDGARVCFEVECGISEAASLESFSVTDDGDLVEQFSGYSVSSVEKTPDGTVRVWCDRALPDSSAQVIVALEGEVAELKRELAAIKAAMEGGE